MRTIATLTIPTRNRPARLEACVRTHLEHARRFDRALRVLVVDDSDPSESEENRRVLDELRRFYRAPIRHVDADAREQFVRSLVRAGASREGADLALMRGPNAPVSTGAARNVAVLANAGSRFVTTDDDIRCAIEGEGVDGAPVLDRRPEPMDTWFYADESEVPPEDAEPADVFAAYEESFRWTDAAGRHVARAMIGVRGESGMGVPACRLLTEGASRERLLDRYDDVALSGCVRRRVRRPTLVDTPFGLGGHLALDAGMPQPPFAPSEVNQDGVFFAISRRLAPHTLTAVLPLTVFHEVRPLTRETLLASTARFRVNDFLMHCILTTPLGAPSTMPGVSPGPAPMDVRFVVLGEALEALAESAGLEASLQEWWRGSRTAWADRADQALASVPRDRCASFHRDVSAVRDAFLPAATIAPDVAPVRRRLGTLGTVLRAWPELRKAAERVRSVAWSVGSVESVA